MFINHKLLVLALVFAPTACISQWGEVSSGQALHHQSQTSDNEGERKKYNKRAIIKHANGKIDVVLEIVGEKMEKEEEPVFILRDGERRTIYGVCFKCRSGAVEVSYRNEKKLFREPDAYFVAIYPKWKAWAYGRVTNHGDSIESERFTRYNKKHKKRAIIKNADSTIIIRLSVFGEYVKKEEEPVIILQEGEKRMLGGACFECRNGAIEVSYRTEKRLFHEPPKPANCYFVSIYSTRKVWLISGRAIMPI